MQKFLVLFFIFALALKMSFAADAACNQPIVTGPCRAAIPSYGYNTMSNACEEFYYGGCGGNSNRYESLDKCQAACEN